nr:Na+/H+ antiporter NhaC family protein [Prevotella sp.]
MSNRNGLLALSPLLVLIVFIVMFTIYSVDKEKDDPNISMSIAFLAASIYAIAISTGCPVNERI